MSQTFPGRCPAFQCRSNCLGSSGRTSLAHDVRAHESVPRWPMRPPGWSWQSAHVAGIHVSGTHPPASLTGPAVFRRSPVFAILARLHRSSSSCERPFPPHHKQSTRPVSQQLPDRDCSSSNAVLLPDASSYSSTASRVVPGLISESYKRRIQPSENQRRLIQPPLSFFVRCSNSPESSHTPPHLSQVSIKISSNLLSLRLPSHRGQCIEDVPAVLASSATFIFARSFSIDSLFLR